MINRRHIRVKVMQSVYAMQQSHSDDILKEEKFLKNSIDKMYDLYVLNLQLLIQVQKLANKRIALSKKKILATKEDLNPNTKFIDNRVINKLNESSSLSAYVELHELNYWELDSEYVRIILDELLNSELYKNYANTPGDSYHIDSAFVVSFFKEIIAPNEKLADYFEDKMISWVDDIPFVNTWIVKSLNKQKEQNPFILGSLYKDSEDKQFVSKLFQKTALNQHTYEDDIIEKTPNWEADRIADIDMIIIKMSITEFLHFPSIPSSVSINEYIEVAKDYSTNKSSYFINGVLDKLSKDYLASNKMVKIGRGLL
ncbi:transcription antitermination factor NusB [Tenacibaculum finnmarkense genomovar finnmarkense]|uniref:transcription antitermination factor NusB n=1 Tax=Tenacibaculum finnmarkense TaxID=2781243 RepID=UPI001E4CA6E0|nr:transcription antitermination factor NusB [Tenacibaculum finnmarkense]MCD8417361.1 transcription antitermination factor NusB [Tenacibaculum finnmarkense genomovar finnmarkense]MCG8185744.1 transcription antitermination factor NusB [Tenacibaculum finnmarkense genomovar finnmarkense]MCG8202297.1 transcription antitermination factor NusB [Tenacibaculum finnmarkense genomovar finnmarkense]MCG8209699.1 transcription antitermination factor NusB [Tenacibaculum finnmarkense genomovar finnmarkense]M